MGGTTQRTLAGTKNRFLHAYRKDTRFLTSLFCEDLLQNPQDDYRRRPSVLADQTNALQAHPPDEQPSQQIRVIIQKHADLGDHPQSGVLIIRPRPPERLAAAFFRSVKSAAVSASAFSLRFSSRAKAVRRSEAVPPGPTPVACSQAIRQALT